MVYSNSHRWYVCIGHDRKRAVLYDPSKAEILSSETRLFEILDLWCWIIVCENTLFLACHLCELRIIYESDYTQDKVI